MRLSHSRASKNSLDKRFCLFLLIHNPQISENARRHIIWESCVLHKRLLTWQPKIFLQYDTSAELIKGLPPILGHPAVEALIKIGNPSIPAVIRNLAESDDAKVRELSLKVLKSIDGDKDISQLRLQKAFKAETASQKQARLQAALKDLEK